MIERGGSLPKAEFEVESFFKALSPPIDSPFL
jgi:hypothetical protein